MYSYDMSWMNWTTEVGRVGDELDNTLARCLDMQQKWYDRVYSMTDSAVAEALGRTVEDVGRMQAATGAFKKLYDAYKGRDTVVVSYDYSGTTRPF